MSDEILSSGELADRCWAIVTAAAENRPDDVGELLVSLPWPDLVTVVFGVAQLGVVLLTPGVDPRDEDARARVAEGVRALLLERAAGREPGRDGA
ncbi:hypothetical protein [Streptomyces hydrogenans]